jgi:hypothetical protein
VPEEPPRHSPRRPTAFTGAAVAAVVWLIGIDRRLPAAVRVGLAAAVIAVGGVMLQVVGKP